MSEYIACTSLSNIIIYYSDYVRKIIVGDTEGLDSLILSMIFQDLYKMFRKLSHSTASELMNWP